jgi:hypothetical protein
MSERKNPYVGPRTFAYKDREWFFGREREARRLLARVISEQLVLFYAQSGVGKSSLINTRLIPQLGKNGFVVLPVGSVGGKLPAEIGEVENVFSTNLMLSLDEGRSDPGRFYEMTLAAFLAELPVERGQHHVLIVDQFEQIVTTHPDRWQDRAGFFVQLNEAMRTDPNLWVVLVVREDYVAPLEPYAPLLRDQMRARFHMQRLDRTAASKAIAEPADKAGRRFAASATKKLVEELCQVRAPGGGQSHAGEFVDPILLQVVCYQLWENLRDRPPGGISIDDLRRAGDIETALRRYYEDAIEEVKNQTGTSEQMLRNWLEEQLITADQTRDIVREEKTQTAGLPNETVKILVARFVLRPIVRTETTWYELTHDRLVKPILDANQAWREANQEASQEWSLKQGVTREFFNPYETANLESWDSRTRRGLLMPVDIYAQAPLAVEDIEAELNTIYVAREPDLMAGPTSARVAVVDYDGDRNTLEEPVQWDRRKGRFVLKHKGERVPITRVHADTPQFHQLNVWATIQSLLHMAEASWVLGRAAPWAFEGNRLIAVPHAGYATNAFYDRHSKSMQFYYYDSGNARVYTCLSQDLIAHETGHAILDGLRPLYYEDSSVQTTAFHEFVADMTAILGFLLHDGRRWEVDDLFGGEIGTDTAVAAFAEAFGQYSMGRPHLRSASNSRTMDSVRESIHPVEWAQVLTGAMLDILRWIVAKQLTKGLSAARPPSMRQAVRSALGRFLRIALQPLDHLPPVDIQFGDYARAVLRAHVLADPVDEDKIRELVTDVLTQRGIDCAPREEETHNIYFYGYETERVAMERVCRSRTDACRFLNENRSQLCIPAEQDISVIDLYQTSKTKVGGGRLPSETVLQYAWREDVKLDGAAFGPLRGEVASLLCGGTMTFDDNGNLLSWVRKPGSGAQKVSAGRRRSYCGGERAQGLKRRKQFMEYVARRVEEGYVGLIERERPYEIDLLPPVGAFRGEDGTLRFEVTPHLRHWIAD